MFFLAQIHIPLDMSELVLALVNLSAYLLFWCFEIKIFSYFFNQPAKSVCRLIEKIDISFVYRQNVLLYRVHEILVCTKY